MAWTNLAEDLAEEFQGLDGYRDFEEVAFEVVRQWRARHAELVGRARYTKTPRPKSAPHIDDRWARQPDVERARRRRWYWGSAEVRRAKALEYHRQNREAVLPKMRARAAARYAANRDEINAKRKAAYHAKRSAMKRVSGPYPYPREVSDAKPG